MTEATHNGPEDHGDWVHIPRDKITGVRFTKDEYAAISMAADSVHRTVSGFVRDAVLKALQHVNPIEN